MRILTGINFGDPESMCTERTTKLDGVRAELQTHVKLAQAEAQVVQLRTVVDLVKNRTDKVNAIAHAIGDNNCVPGRQNLGGTPFEIANFGTNQNITCYCNPVSNLADDVWEYYNPECDEQIYPLLCDAAAAEDVIDEGMGRQCTTSTSNQVCIDFESPNLNVGWGLVSLGSKKKSTQCRDTTLSIDYACPQPGFQGRQNTLQSVILYAQEDP